jgi:hypothetical protein
MMRSRNPLRTAVLVLALAWAAVAAGDPVAQAVEHAERARFAAMIARDMEALDRMVANDLYYCHSTAEVENKARFLETIRTQRVRYDAIDIKDIEVRVLAADVALVNGLVHLRGNLAGKDIELDLRYVDTYVMRDARWQLLAWQSTRVPPDTTHAPKPAATTGTAR